MFETLYIQGHTWEIKEENENKCALDEKFVIT